MNLKNSIKKKNRKKRTADSAFPSYRYFIICIITLFFILFPYITYIHIEELSGNSLKFFSNTDGIWIDFLLYTKEIVLFIFCIFLVLFFIGEHIFPDHVIKHSILKNPKLKKAAFLLFIYLFFSVLSAFFSENKSVVLFGSCTEYEGLFALFSYIILFFAGVIYLSAPVGFSVFKKGLAAAIFIVSILTMIEYLYKPLLELPFIPYLIAPEKYRFIASSLKNENFQGQAALCFYNPGYLGGFLSLLFPISLSFFFSSTTKFLRIIWGFFTCLVFFSLIASNSTAAIYSSIIALLLFLIILRKSFKTWFPYLIYLLLFSIFSFLIINTLSENALSATLFKTVQNKSALLSKSEKYKLTELKLENGILTAVSKDNSFRAALLDGANTTLHTLKITNQENQTISSEFLIDGSLHLTESGFESIYFKIEDNLLSIDFGYSGTVEFYCTDSGLFAIGQNGIPLSSIPSAPIHGLEKFYSIATGRGYIWINSLPILSKCLFLGKGPGNFVFSFTQNDIVGLLNTHGSCKFVIDKPHNWYLQIAIHSGIPALITLLCIFIPYFLRNSKKYLFSSASCKNSIIPALFLGIVSFFSTGLVNDSIVSVNPIFWILFGVSFGLYIRQTNQQSNDVKNL